MLYQLAEHVPRPIRLIMRGGVHTLRKLALVYKQIIFVDTESFIKTHKRQRAEISPNGKCSWHSNLTKDGELLDNLLQENIRMKRSYIEGMIGKDN